MKAQLFHERAARGWTQEFVAKQIGVTPELISMMENGQRRPSYEVLLKLEDLFQMNHRDLFAEVSDSGSQTVKK